MTELETQLLAALERSRQQFKTEQAALRTMFDATSKANTNLQKQVTGLSEQVTNLAEQVSILSNRLPK
ncbi:MbeD/MobD family mobilization/exclusion protein [Aeromonas caviae]|uniref:MbeD/MobD family mobilization/exclusion protein n=1 Tax=Aeromonas caviae TaxID=648 RepID=UPI001CC553B3|nr:MbeD/MobD family mobilization/exclusion protein [Aeromonas caviae]GJA34597.1 hypothetical protein KAM341_42750 [Aeromonas caviae]